MPAKLSSAELLRRYVDGRLTAPQEAELERRAEEDPDLGAALEALRQQPAADHAIRVDRLRERATRAGGRTAPPPPAARRSPVRWYAVAATLALLLVGSLLVLPRFMDTASRDLALESAPTGSPATVDTAEEMPPPPAPAAVPEPEQEAMERLEEPATAPPPVTTERQTRRAAERRTTTPVQLSEADVAEASKVREEGEDAGAKRIPEGNAAGTSNVGPQEEALEAEPVAAAPVPRISSTTATRTTVAPPDSLTSFEGIADDDFRRGNAIAYPARPEPRYLTGRITDGDDNPVAGALIRLPGQPLGERSDSNGVFRFPADATVSRLLISANGFGGEEVDIGDPTEALVISLDAEPEPAAMADYLETASVTRIRMDPVTGLPRYGDAAYAAPAVGTRALRKRLETEAPEELEAGRVRVSFLVSPNGQLSDFRFRGSPSQAVMEYVGNALVETSTWNVVNAQGPVRVHFKLRLE